LVICEREETTPFQRKAIWHGEEEIDDLFAQHELLKTVFITNSGNRSEEPRSKLRGITTSSPLGNGNEASFEVSHL
jgi:hypothetical protein